MLEAAWPGEAAPPAHSDTHLVGTIADAPADALHESRAAELIEACAAGGMRCGNGLPPTLSPTPPLRLLLYAHAPLEPAPKAIDRSGRPLPPGDGFVLPPTGALLPWACDGDNAACLETMHAGLVAVLRRLMGLKESRSERLNEIAAGEAESDLGVHWLEASALQLACVHAHLSAAQTSSGCSLPLSHGLPLARSTSTRCENTRRRRRHTHGTARDSPLPATSARHARTPCTRGSMRKRRCTTRLYSRLRSCPTTTGSRHGRRSSSQ